MDPGAENHPQPLHPHVRAFFDRKRRSGPREQVAANVARNVTAFREQKGWSKTDLARELTEQGWEVPRQTVHKIETAQRSVPVEDLWALAQGLDVTIDELVRPRHGAPIEDLYKTAVNRRIAATNAMVDYHRAKQRLKDALRGSNDLDAFEKETYEKEVDYPFAKIPQDSQRLAVQPMAREDQ